ncbi:MAG: GTPase ObgE [Bacillota bacterium]|nr:GTPase ObgE [Bacillota bacterium]
MFIDKAKITVKSGKGGNGCVSFRREPFVPDGGPDGGDGGSGGSVIFEADENFHTLMDFHYKVKYNAENGEDGMKRKKFGKKGKDLKLKVPPGTLIIDQETGHLIKDLKKHGDSCVVAKGGKGGKGNVHFKNSVRQAPNFAEAGGKAVERTIILELKMIADVGLMGFPNVGKSTLLAAVTGARPKIANYHFTTLTPNLGVVQFYDDSFIMADIPGIIEGAHEGQGLGLDFLRHIERTKLLIHVVDVSSVEGRDMIEDFEKINEELVKYSPKLAEKPQIVAANKIDSIMDQEKYEEFIEYVKDRGYEVFPVSAAGRQGLDELLKAAMNKVSELRELPEEDDYVYFDLEEADKDPEYREIKVTVEDGVFVLSGGQLEKIFDSTNFNDMESLRYLYKYIEEKGAMQKMIDMGIKDEDTVRIKDFEFDYYE